MTDVIADVVTALNAHDLDRLVACYAAEATIENAHDHVRARGRKELRDRYAAMFDRFPEVHVEVARRTNVGEFVVQEEVVTGRGATERHIAVYLVRDGLIVRERLIA